MKDRRQYYKNWRKLNKKKTKEYEKNRRTTKHRKTYSTKYYLTHKETLSINGKKRLKEWRKLNKEREILYELQNKHIRKKWRKENREKLRHSCRKRRAKRKKVIHQFTQQEWIDKLQSTKGICPDCKRFVGIENFTLDHIHPISKAKNGQVYTIDDVQPLCQSCNSKKKDTVYSVHSANGKKQICSKGIEVMDT